MPHIHHLTLTVSDDEKFARRYQDLPGNTQVVEHAMLGWRRARMAWSDGLVIGVTQFEGPTPEQFTHVRVGLDHVGPACAGPDEARAWAQTWTSSALSTGRSKRCPMDER